MFAGDALVARPALQQRGQRRARTRPGSEHPDPAIRIRLVPLYEAWSRFNEEFFAGQLNRPRLIIGPLSSRCLGRCQPAPSEGGPVEIHLHEGLVLGSNTDWVNHPWPPAEGTGKFIEDLLLRFTVRQYVLEVLGGEEPLASAFGGKYVRVANRLHLRLGLPDGVPRRRASCDHRPCVAGWPHNHRRDDYYGADVTEELLELARALSWDRAGRSAPTRGLLGLLAYLARNDRAADMARLVLCHEEWRLSWGTGTLERRREVEKGHQDVDGSPLGEVTFRREWVDWNGGTVLKMARSISQHSSYQDLPLLADALEEAGCQDGRILRHLRERMLHDSDCWIVRGLLRVAHDW